ncbi:MAG: restriction endonuclease subunit S [Holdemanella sp.]|nr:restriction endonuclease subunit S [Holdemanella sp.]
MDKKNKNPNVPNLRFSYKGDWSKRKLNEICQFFKGNGLSKSDLSNEGFPCILYGELYTTYKNEVISDIISKTNTTLSNPFLSRNNDLIIPGSGEDPIDIAVARAIYQNDIILGGDLNILRPKSNVSAAFLSYQLNGVRRYDIAKKAQGKSIVHLHNSDLKEVLVSIPSYEEQLHIVKLLTKIDEMIEIQSKIIDDYNSLKMGIYNWMFKENCADYKLKQLANIVKGDQINNNQLLSNGSYYMMNGGTLPSGYLDSYNVSENTISISEGGNSCGYVQFNKERFWSGGHCYTIQNVNPLIVENKYLYHYLKHKEKEIMNLRIGTGLPNIQKKDLENFTIFVPNLLIQRKNLALFEMLDEKICILNEELERLEKQKKYLLRNLFI